MGFLSSQNVVAGRYRLEKEIARGGMGSVWLALDKGLEREVAIKFMDAGLAASSAARQRFEREAKSAARLRSHHAVQIFDYGVDDGRPFIVMELLEGEDLRARLRRKGRMSIDELAPIALQVAAGLEAAHTAGVVHRDLKPGNIFLANSGGEEIVKLLDFGIAKALSAGPAGTKVTTSTSGTKKGMMMGTPHYMSPEQARASKRVDHRADLWAFGVVLFRALTGRLPFTAELLAELLMQICVDPLPVPSDIAPDLPPPVDRFFERAFSRDPAGRFLSARAMGAAFAELETPLRALQAARMKVGSGAAERAGVNAMANAGARTEPASTRTRARNAGRFEAVRKALGSGAQDARDATGLASGITRRTAAPAPSAPSMERTRAVPPAPSAPAMDRASDAIPPSRRDSAPLSIRGRGRVWIEWDSAQGVATALHYAVNLSDEDAVRAYKTEVSKELSRFGRKVPLLVCLDGITGAPKALDRALHALEELGARFAAGVAYYGQKSALQGFPALAAKSGDENSRWFDDRLAALEFVTGARGTKVWPPLDGPR